MHLYIPKGTKLTIPDGITLNNDGWIIVMGDMVGSPTNSDRISWNVDSIELRSIIIDREAGDKCPGHVITGNSKSNNITVIGGTHNITLLNICIEVNGKAAFSIENTATVNLTLKGNNTLKSGNNCAGLQVSENGILIITEESTGSLTATGGSNGAGIGGGDITINGGKITVNNIQSGKVTISGGTVTSNGNITGSFSTGNTGNALIFASSISDHSEKDNWSGIIFEGNVGQVYGNPSIQNDVEIPSNKCLYIPKGSTLTIPEGVTLKNDGWIANCGKINGALTNTGTIIVGKNGNNPGNWGGTVLSYSGGTYLNDVGIPQNIPDEATFLLPGMTQLSAGWYVVCGNVVLPKRPVVSGNVHIVLLDGYKLDAQQGITVSDGNSLTTKRPSSLPTPWATTSSGSGARTLDPKPKIYELWRYLIEQF